jgi:anti-anti-sigma factor
VRDERRRIIVSLSVWVPFQVVESRDADGVLRMALSGELDIAVADRFSARLEELSRDRTCVRLDLSQLEFIDSSGILVLVRCAQNGSAGGQQLVEVGREVTEPVRRVIDLVEVTPILWPDGGSQQEHGKNRIS